MFAGQLLKVTVERVQTQCLTDSETHVLNPFLHGPSNKWCRFSFCHFLPGGSGFSRFLDLNSSLSWKGENLRSMVGKSEPVGPWGGSLAQLQKALEQIHAHVFPTWNERIVFTASKGAPTLGIWSCFGERRGSERLRDRKHGVTQACT